MDALARLNPLAGGALAPGPAGLGLPGLPGQAAGRCCAGNPCGVPSMDPLMQLVMMQQQITMLMLQILLELLSGRGGGSSSGVLGGGGGGGVAGTSAGSYGGGAAVDAGPVKPGTEGMLEHANRMVGLHENRDTAAIQQVTGKSGINPATTPWCAAWAMNLLEQHGVLKLDGLSNRNYVPTIKSWAQGKGIWQEGGRYTPKPGDAIAFDWNGDGTPDHIGIVERVSGGRVYTIEGNSSDQVKKNSYALGSSDIDGYLRT